MVSIGLEQILAATCCVDVSLGCHVRSTQKSAQNHEKNVGRRPYEKTTFERRGVLALVQVHLKTGCKDVKLKLYKDGRHEMLNELNKDEVYADVLEWLNSKI